ncbi:MAG: thioredoxin domain-containing protein [Candidatus Bathyarchaeota archaeon]
MKRSVPVKKKPNRLIDEKSPYLLQHAYNPVNWYPWTEEAFHRAQREDKPIFLSIGYSACHWCHVMEKESFEDSAVASLLNNHFVSIKVDREERPDIDNLYMQISLLTTGGGGWSLTILMTANRQPFLTTTYLPKESTLGRLGLIDLLKTIIDFWAKNRQKFTETARTINQYLVDSTQSPAANAASIEDVIDAAYVELLNSFDHKHGGFGTQPKFPTPHNLFFLLRYWKKTGTQQALDMVEKTLRNMRLGGIYDQLGFGFHRYSTDSSWIVPHFEKMLYDQALLSLAYLETYQATGKEDYRTVVEEIFEYITRNMSSPMGGFYSAEDADSEGQEGKFYLWTHEELEEVLDASFSLIKKTYNIAENGNYFDELNRGQQAKNIFYIGRNLDDVATEVGLEKGELVQRLENTRHLLLSARDRRVPPTRDDKILTDWNGLMIAAFAKAAQIFDDPKYSEIARRATEFILHHLKTSEGRLLHRFREGEATILGLVDDYTFLIFGLIELYEATFAAKYLSEAIHL